METFSTLLAFVQGVPLTNVSDAVLWCFLWFKPWINHWVNNHDTCDLRCHGAHYDVIVMNSSPFHVTRLLVCHPFWQHILHVFIHWNWLLHLFISCSIVVLEKSNTLINFWTFTTKSTYLIRMIQTKLNRLKTGSLMATWLPAAFVHWCIVLYLHDNFPVTGSLV